jgi:hypothetical protein
MTEDTFNPEARDGDNDGIVQEGTPFERPIEELEVNPVEEEVVAEVEEAPAVIEEEPVVVVAPEPEDEAPAIVPVENGVIGAGKTKKKRPEPKKPEPVEEKSSTVALLSSRNLVWQGLGKLVKGYNIVSADAAEKWLTLDAVRVATPEEIKTTLG